jgi:hypothetical protein
MTVPVDDLADLVSARLLARAVDELAAPPPGQTEDNRAMIEQFYASCGLEELRLRAPEEFREPNRVRGAQAITAALRTRGTTMESRIPALIGRLRSLAPKLARDFDYRRGIREALSGADPFRLQRVVFGSPHAASELDRAGFIGSLESRRSAPPPPAATAGPSVVEPFKRRIGRQLDWSDPEVRRVITRQNTWYTWRTEAAWNTAWGDLAAVWDLTVNRLRGEVGDLASAFIAHSREEAAAYDPRTAELYRSRTGVTYLLPPLGDLDLFYRTVVRRFVGRPDLGLRPTSTEAEIVAAILGPDGWRRGYELVADSTSERRFETAVLHVRNLLKQEVKRMFGNRGAYGTDQPLLPAMRDLLARSAGKDGPVVGEDDLAAFRRGVAALLPAAYVPQGTGNLKVLVAYPQAAKDPQVERYLRDHVNLPDEPDAQIQFRAIDTESITVVLLRTSMGVTEVPELRQILTHWSDALRNKQQQDFLPWRQRLGYNFRWLATTEADRILITQRLLCAMWNDQIKPLGDWESPHGVIVRLRQGQRVDMQLHLDSFGRASSWVDLLRAYEEWTFAEISSGEERIRQDFCRDLMETLPNNLSRQAKPSKLYQWFMDRLAPQQIEVLDDMIAAAPTRGRAWMQELRDFWAVVVPEANQLPFLASQDEPYQRLADLHEAFKSADDGTDGEPRGARDGAYRYGDARSESAGREDDGGARWLRP